MIVMNGRRITLIRFVYSPGGRRKAPVALLCAYATPGC